MRTAAVIVAAGRGVRAGFAAPKQFQQLLGRAVLDWSVRTLSRATDRVVVVAPADRLADVREAHGGEGVLVVPGGATRIASVRAGLEALAPVAPDIVLVHDAARPGVSGADVAALIDALGEAEAAAPVLPVADALKRAVGDLLAEDLDRAGLVRVQTPQALRFDPYLQALRNVADDAAFDDDIAIARAAGLRAVTVPGAARLAKITYAEDLDVLARLLAPTPRTPRIGSGFDAHRFGPGGQVTLCGVPIPHEAGLLGHSDADVAWHALTDALLASIAAGDIGDHFPPSDDRWRGAPSLVFLQHAADLVRAAGGSIVNVDVTIVCERPRVKPYREAMRASTAQALQIPASRVSVKATTTEEMGFTGRREGIAAQATALALLPPEDGDVS